ncbi:transporter substrate-binding domain-containing protein [Gilvimarinus sp. SDUM040013]|uniref:Transporter substrate-binding domain-containing protein n=1 Tax=Gilvimarinus gilvus TaxID=3058038 RepID=A0ABU4RZM0_9GAMM|nr:transporter substrate-binding domain-containing protein [Gilvimarinus sp. SDUM040013]MDO3386487.1 transporter substrate-binding domain-containing protein [Gilvimarinus sp. SDUM040013]MDX6849063.1 transporter substrate-binding domain-containing protein [Gilvimarinus sp. SDUM040013]
MRLYRAQAKLPALVVWLLGLLLALTASNLSAGTSQRLVVPMYGAEDPHHDSYFFSRLLKLALDKTVSEYGPYTLEIPEVMLTDDRLKAQVVKGTVDVMWHSSIGSEDMGLRMIPVSLLGELSEYRAFLVRHGDQARFNNIHSLDDLRQMVAGIGAQWPGVPVLKKNDLPYVSSSRYELLFRMLAADRFDYFPRGLYQIHSEPNLYPEFNLVVESEILLHYPNDVYFFVREDNSELAERLRLGLERAQEDGSKQRLMETIPRFHWAQQELARGQRRVIKLQMP